MFVRRVSVISGIERVINIPVDANDFVLWEMGLGSIQELMPYLSDEDREFILSGIMPEEWAAAFEAA